MPMQGMRTISLNQNSSLPLSSQDPGVIEQGFVIAAIILSFNEQRMRTCFFVIAFNT